MATLNASSWVGVDLDSTLAIYPHSWPGIGPPIPVMVERVKQLLDAGVRVKIFTARVSLIQGEVGESGDVSSQEFVDDQRAQIEAWSQDVFGQVLEVTAQKDFQMILLIDDRCVQAESNTGRLVGEGFEIAGLAFT